MKKLTVLYTAFLLVFCFNQLSAQGHYMLDPYNIPSVTTEIFTDYSTDIFLPESIVEQHLTTIVNPQTYNAEMANASLDVSMINEDEVSLSWDNQGPGVSYQIAYQHLQNGATNFYSLSSGSTSLLLNNMPDGLYAFSITSHTGGTGPIGGNSSFADIIIIEKVIFRNGASSYLCDCEESVPVFDHQEDLGFADITIAWTPEVNEQYVLKIEYVDESYYDAYLSFRPIPIEEGEEDLNFRPICLGNVWHPDVVPMNPFPVATSTLYAYDENNHLQLGMSYTNYTWYLLHLSEPVMKSVSLKKCAGNSAVKEQEYAVTPENNALDFSNTAVQKILYPNPARDQINFLLADENWNTHAQIEIYDQAGQLVLIKTITNNLTNVTINGLQSGMYTARVNTGEKMYIERFVKIN